jgi:hypothetical protein
LINNAQIESDAYLAPSALFSDSLFGPKQEIVKEEQQSRIDISFYVHPQVDELGLENRSNKEAYNKEQGSSKRR